MLFLKFLKSTNALSFSSILTKNLLIALDYMKRYQVGTLPIISRTKSNKLLGVLTPKDIINYLKHR